MGYSMYKNKPEGEKIYMRRFEYKKIILGMIIIFCAFCIFAGCEKESNKFNMNDGVKFKEAAKSEQDVTGSGNNNHEGKKKNPNKEGTESEEESIEEETTKAEENTETEKIEDNKQENEKETNLKEQKEKKSSEDKKSGGEGNNKDDSKKGNKDGGTNGGKDYDSKYEGETIEIYVEIEEE